MKECLCGCKQPAPTGKMYVHGHNAAKNGKNLGWTEDDRGCWIWTKYITVNGYGGVTYKGKSMTAHRAAWLELVGAIPDATSLDHLCRNRACVNPAHLEPVSIGENCRRGKSSKLNWEKVKKMREMYRAGGITQHAISKIYGVSFSTAVDVLRNKSWVNR